jgi:AraC-like DNA-binding protein
MLTSSRQSKVKLELVRAAAMTGYFNVADELQLDVVPLLRKFGFTSTMLSTPEQVLPARSVVRLLEESSHVSGCETFGLRMAEHRQLSDLGLVSLLIAHQPTLRDGLEVLSEYRHRINSNLTLQIEDCGDTVFLREHLGLNPPVLSRQANDVALGVLYGMCRAIMPPVWRPQCVCFSYERPSPGDRRIYDRLFDCSLQFGADFDGMVVGKADLDRQNPRSDPALARHARQLVAAMIDPGARTIEEEVEQSIRLLMPLGRASVSEVSHALGTNVRTLQRQLRRDGVLYSELLDRVREQQVDHHLVNRRLSLTDVAHLLGYSTLSSFSAWYRARFGKTPSDGRVAPREADQTSRKKKPRRRGLERRRGSPPQRDQ